MKGELSEFFGTLVISALYTCHTLYVFQKLREHLARCYEEGSFDRDFPTLSPKDSMSRSFPASALHLLGHNFRKVRRRILLPDRTVDLICRCRMPPGKGCRDQNVTCRGRNCDIKVFHENCIKMFDKENFMGTESHNWRCPVCIGNSEF